MEQMGNREFEVLEQRLDLIKRLGWSLEKSIQAVLQSNPGRVILLSGEQREFCRDLHRNLHEKDSSIVRYSGTDSSEVVRRFNELLRRISEAGIEVRRLALLYAALLRRSRRTIDIIYRALASSGATYGLPTESAALPALVERSHV